MEDEPRMDTSRPSTLRLAGFALIAGGALLMGIGSRLDWVTVGLSQVSGSQTSYVGSELGAGKIALGAAILLLILVIAGRMGAERWRTAISIAMLAIAGVATAIAAWFAISAPDHYSPVDDDQLVGILAQALQKSPDEIRAGLTNVINQLGGYTHLGPGPWLVIVGGIFAMVGSVLTLRWARRVRTNEGAGEPTPSVEPWSA